MDQNQKKPDLRGALEMFLKLHRIAAVVLITLAAVIAASFFLAMRSDFDYTIGHFDSSSLTFNILKAAAVAAAVVCCALALVARRSASFADDPAETPITTFAAVLTALMCVIGLVSSAFDISLGVSVDKFGMVSLVLLPFIGISMILSLIPSLSHSRLRQITAILAILSVNFSMFSDYFDFTLPLNSPIRNLVTVMKSAALIYLLSEARFSFGIKSGRAAVPFFILASGTAGSLTLGYSVGAALFSILNTTADNPNPDLISLALYAAIGIHAIGRFTITVKSAGEYVEPKTEEKEDKKKKKESKTA